MEKKTVKYGSFIALGLIVYFLTVRLLGMHENPWLRILNGVIVAFGIYKVIKDVKAQRGVHFNYFDGFKAGIISGFVATLIFTLFMGIYIFHIDTAFAEKIMAMSLGSVATEPGLLLFIILIEGFASTVILSLLFMQKFKPSWNIPNKL
ncbi:DUF4199 domain-containing protein [Kordia sp. YSTF-M3]|uniref:DUF4199 domain-containing protein n=1 Tax=Kordia aestuariivivens TaxID=2759037 RepID=A0ABR7QAI3_9FLAO|nr:DUF4199 domain-containing protein [Kordia aestuariivivens]MBC8755580.1 DUF4199 domain-containing protein [Kordia aestuariivivens]